MEPLTRRLLVLSAVGLAVSATGIVYLGARFFRDGFSVTMLAVNAGLLLWLAVSWWSESSVEGDLARWKRHQP